jgi:uncharacterized membrane protein YgcG
MDEELLLERCLEGLETWQTSVSACADHHQADHPEVIADLRLAQRLRQVRLPEQEVAGARARVRLTVLTAIEAEPVATPVQPGEAPLRDSASSSVAEPPRRRSDRPRLRVPRPPALLAAALILIALLGGWMASNAATNALPSSPLYGLKRVEEGLALVTAWSDQRRGDVLLMMAGRRLVEIRAETHDGDVAAARALAADFDATMHHLIELTATMQTHHEDTHRITAGLAHTLAAENEAIRTAQQSGQTIVAQTLATAAQSQQIAIQANSVTLPPVSTARPGTGTTAGTPSTGAGVTPPTTPTPTPLVGPGVPPTGSTGSSSGGSGASGGKGGPGSSGGPGGHGPGRGVRPGSIGAVGGSLAFISKTTCGAGQPAVSGLTNQRQPV